MPDAVARPAAPDSFAVACGPIATALHKMAHEEFGLNGLMDLRMWGHGILTRPQQQFVGWVGPDTKVLAASEAVASSRPEVLNQRLTGQLTGPLFTCFSGGEETNHTNFGMVVPSLTSINMPGITCQLQRQTGYPTQASQERPINTAHSDTDCQWPHLTLFYVAAKRRSTVRRWNAA